MNKGSDAEDDEEQRQTGLSKSNSQQESSLYTQQKMINDMPLVCIRGETTKELLHRSIIALRIKDSLAKNRYIYGSGVLLSPNLILTAAHNIFDKKQGIQFQKVDFQIFEGIDGVAEIFHEVEGWIYLEDFKTCKNSEKLEFDYALIKLKPSQERPITYDQFLEVRLPCNCILDKNPQVKLDVYGYPIYKQNYEPLNKQLTRLELFQYGLTISEGILKVDPSEFKITYAINTLGGHSGGPVVAQNQIISIHSGAASKKEENWNIGRLITSELLRNLKKWVKQLGGNPYIINQEMLCPHKTSKIHGNQAKSETKKKLEESNLKEFSKSPSKMAATKINLSIFEADQLKRSAFKLQEEYKYELALQKYSKSITIYENLQKGNTQKIAEILVYGTGDIYEKQDNYSNALEAYEKGLNIYQKKEGESQNTATSLNNIGWVYSLRSEYGLALDFYKRALEIRQKIKGKNSVDAGKTINNIGLIFLQKGEYALSLQHLQRSLQIQERAGEGRSIGAAHTHNNIGNVYRYQVKQSLALKHYQKALNIYVSIQGMDSIDAAGTKINIALIYSLQKDFHRAIKMYQQAIPIYEKHQFRHRDYALAHSYLGNTFYYAKHYKEAEASFRVSIPIFEKIGIVTNVKKDSLSLARCLTQLGMIKELESVIKKYGVEKSNI